MDGMYPLIGLVLAREIQHDHLVAAEKRRAARLARTPRARQGQPAGPDVAAGPRPAGWPGASDCPQRPDGLHCVSGIRLGPVVLDCPEPAKLAEFYRGVLGGEVTEERDDWVELEVDGHTLAFQKVQIYQPPSWPDGPPQQFHLDLLVEGYAGTHELVTSLGARPLDPVDPPPAENGRTWRVYADPVGHPFCLCMC